MAASETQRSRTVILGAVLVVLIAVLAFMWWPAAAPAPAPAGQARDQRRPVGTSASAETTPSELEVRLDDLKQGPPEPAGENRNPFRFYVKPPPPPPPPPPVVKVPVGPPPRVPQPGDPDYVPPPPPPPPPIPIKFIGTAEKGGKKWAIFSDGRGAPVWAAEGETVLGQWKLVRIGVESVVMEYPDGRGRQTIPMRGGTQ